MACSLDTRILGAFGRELIVWRGRTIRRALLPALLSPMVIAAAVQERPPAAEPVELVRSGNRVDVQIGGRPFTTFYFDPSIAKPYFFPLRSAESTVVTRGFPMATDTPGEHRDEPHQRAMYFAHGDVNGFDFWGEAAFPAWSDHGAATFGRTIFRTLDDMQGGPQSGRLKSTFDLVTPAGAIADEIQTYRFEGDPRTRIIDCEFTVRATHGPIIMGDTKEGTFAIRVARTLESPPGHMVNAGGASGERGIWGKRSEWVDYYGRVGTEDVGVAILDHPDNLRSPTYWHARAYGLLAANPFGVSRFTGDRRQNGRYSIPSGGSLRLRYRVIIHHGSPREATVADAYRQFAADR